MLFVCPHGFRAVSLSPLLSLPLSLYLRLTSFNVRNPISPTYGVCWREGHGQTDSALNHVILFFSVRRRLANKLIEFDFGQVHLAIGFSSVKVFLSDRVSAIFVVFLPGQYIC